jgi:acetyl-CoA synthetase
MTEPNDSAVVIPASTLLGPADLEDRIARGDVKHVITETAHTPKFAGLAGTWTRVAVGADVNADGWHNYQREAYDAPPEFTPGSPTRHRALDPGLRT